MAGDRASNVAAGRGMTVAATPVPAGPAPAAPMDAGIWGQEARGLAPGWRPPAGLPTAVAASPDQRRPAHGPRSARRKSPAPGRYSACRSGCRGTSGREAGSDEGWAARPRRGASRSLPAARVSTRGPARPAARDRGQLECAGLTLADQGLAKSDRCPESGSGS